MALIPCRDINSSFTGITGSSRTTGLKLQSTLRGGTMAALLELIQSNGPHRQHEKDADSQSCENGPEPICMSNHGIICLGVPEPGGLPHCLHGTCHS
jgi:hypothetical protein